jgi:serine protease Do/serine protease DegQ
MPRLGPLFAPRTPRLGVDVEDLDGDLGKYFGAPDGEGVLVRGVSSGSAAEKAGIKAGDVIIKVAGERVRTSSDLREGLREKRENKKVDIVVIRKGTEMTLPVEMEQVTPPEGRRIARRVAA